MSRLKNIYNIKRSYENWEKYKKQRNFCVKLLRKNKTGLLQKYIDIKSVGDTKKFCKMIKPYLSGKGLNSNKIFLSEKGGLIKDPAAIATTMNDYFVDITETIGLKQFQFDPLVIYSKIIQVLLESNLIWTMFQINLVLKKCMRKKSNGKS